MGDYSTILQEIDVSILSNDDCDLWNDYLETLPNIMVCVRNHEGSPCMVRICDLGYDFHLSITANYLFSSPFQHFPNILVFLKGQIISKRFFPGQGFFKKTNENTSHTSKNEFIRSFFGRILGQKKTF